MKHECSLSSSRGFDVTQHIHVPLRDLGELIPGMEGIWIPEPEIGADREGVTEQFLDNAASYHERFANVAYFASLLSRAFERVDVSGAGLRILDLGSGSGNSVLPCLQQLPASCVVAVDISANLLRILISQLGAEAGLASRVAPVCMSAMSDYYRSESFQLVVGAAILHHLIDPGAAIEAAGKALEPGRSAIFFEPFENGNAILRLAYRDILERASRGRIRRPREPGFAVLREMVTDLEVRLQRDAQTLRTRDDKWLLSRSMLEALAERGGFRGLEIFPLHAVDEPFSGQTRNNLNLAAGLGPEALPAWAWERLVYYDNAFSEDLKRDLMIEGCVILTR